MKFDYLLTGASGQVGRYILRSLVDRQANVAVTMRRKTTKEAVDELCLKTGLDPRVFARRVTVFLGDLTDNSSWELPEAAHIINSAGHTSLGLSLPQQYWKSNILTAIRLAHHANFTGAKSFHQFSSVAVAEFRDTILTEYGIAIPDERQLTYSTSKVLVELAVHAIRPSTQILRIGDIVPPVDRIKEDIRASHWLPILFKLGKDGFNYADPDYSVWLADSRELAEAVMILIDQPEIRFHLLGNAYSWKTFQESASNLPAKDDHRMARWMTKIILYGPEAKQVSQNYTWPLLAGSGFEWTRLDSTYWRTFAHASETLETEVKNGSEID